MILHHIADSHEWHFFGNVSIPLPVILLTDNGLVTFLSNKFGHNDHGTEIIDASGTKLVNYHGKFYYPSKVKSADGTYISHDSQGELIMVNRLIFQLPRM